MKKPLKLLRKPPNYQQLLLSNVQKIKEYNYAWPDDSFCGTDTAKPGISVGPLFCRPCARVETAGKINFILM